MTDANSKPQQWSGPGVMQSNIKLRKDSIISQETLEKWWEDEYLPIILETGIVKSAWTYKAANPDNETQFLMLYKVTDLAAVQAGKLRDIPRTSKLFPTDEPVDNFIELESRIFSFVQLYETEKQPEDAATTIIYAAMQPKPGGEADLDSWYRDEHNEQMSKEPGWKRTTRFSLLHHMRNDGQEPKGLDFLAIHEFGDGNKVGKDVEALEPISDWTKRILVEQKAIDAAVYHKVKSFGKAADPSYVR